MLAKANFWVLTILFNFFSLDFVKSGETKFRCYRGSVDVYQEEDMNEPDALITDSNPCVDVKKVTVIPIPGYESSVNGPFVETIVSEYVKNGNYNVILANWVKDANGIGLGPIDYPIVVANSKSVAAVAAHGIVRMVGLGLSNDIILLGHSLGANLAGEACRRARDLNLHIPRIIALDPARLLFNPPVVYPPVGSDCGGFVVVAHTDPGGFALDQPTGHADVYFNYGSYQSGTKRQPGCALGTTPNEIFTNGNSCSHDRSWEYYAVALENPHFFMVGGASNYDEFVQRNGSFDHVTYFGPEIDTGARGNYYCTTSDTEPWGLEEQGLYPPA